MGLLSALLGHASEIDGERLEEEFARVLIPGEEIRKAYKLIRDLIVFTDKRIVFVDKQGVTGKKREMLSVPYRHVVRFSKETAGHADIDAELKIWIRGESEPIVREFGRGNDIDEVYRTLAEHVL